MSAELTFVSLPQTIVDVLRSLANFWTLGIVVIAFAVLAWFVYSVFLRKLLRVRRIANLRLRRMLEERETDASGAPPRD